MRAEFQGGATQTFTVSGTPGEFAPEAIYLNRTPAVQGWSTPEDLASVSEVQALIESLPTGAVAVLEVLEPVSEPDGTWLDTGKSYSTVGLKDPHPLAYWKGCRLRMKSGGTSGTGKAHARWWG